MSDTLDNVFENLSTPGELETASPYHSQIANPEVQILLEALAEDHQPAVSGLAALASRIPRPYLQATLIGAINYVSKVTTAPSGQEALDQLQTTVCNWNTSQNETLSTAESQELEAMAAALHQPRSKEVAQLETYLKLAVELSELSPEDVGKLFSVGLWRPAFIMQASTAESAQLSNLPEGKIETLKAALKKATQ